MGRGDGFQERGHEAQFVSPSVGFVVCYVYDIS